MAIRQLGARILARWQDAWPKALAASIAAALSWLLARLLFGHDQPLFAAITAIVCLSPGLPSRGRQALGILLGVGTGIAVGEFALGLPDIPLPLQMSIAAFFAIVIATSFGWPPVVPIQAGVSAVLVLALGPGTGGQVRMLDVALGAGVGLFFSQVLMTPDPVRTIENAVRGFFRQLASGFAECGQAVAAGDAGRAMRALQMLSTAHDSLVALRTGVESARAIARWTLRGRLVGRKVTDKAALYDQQAIRLYAAALLFAEAVAEALRKNEAPPPRALRDRIARIEKACAHIAETGGSEEVSIQLASVSEMDEPVSPSWRLCVTYLQAVEDTLNALTAPV